MHACCAGYCGSTEHCCKAERSTAWPQPHSKRPRKLWQSALLLRRPSSPGCLACQARLQGPPNGGTGPHSDALAAAQAVAARLSAQAAPYTASNASGSGGYSAPPPQTYTPTVQASAPQQSSESKQEQAIRAAEAVAARFSAQVAAPAAPTTRLLRLQVWAGARRRVICQQRSTAPPSTAFASPAPAPAQDPVAAARAVAARLAGQMGQPGAPHPGASSTGKRHPWPEWVRPHRIQ